ncbi:hypothetical protein JCM8202_001085 [Rhodotorula sphaerocarpa]
MAGGLETSKSIETTADDPRNPSEVLYHVACHFLDQLEDFLQRTVTTDAQLSQVSKLSPGSTVGKHIRHLTDHYRLLLEGLSESGASAATKDEDAARLAGAAPLPPIHVNYDVRLRNGPVETSHQACLDSVVQLKERLARETGEGHEIDPERRVRLTATTPVEVQVSTSFARELWFASFHAVHHFALIRVIAAGELGVEVPKDFGVAPSTLVHRQEDHPPGTRTPSKL